VFAFELESTCPVTRARVGRFTTPHGAVATPVFMPVGTRATVKGVRPDELRAIGTEMVLANTYHLHLRPGDDVVRELGGLHRFMNWNGPILTDSGGYQVFSLAHLARVDEDGVTFKSIVDGSSVRFTPERVVDIERALGADVIMAFDECPPDPLARDAVSRATERTHRWLARCVRRWQETGGLESGQALFGIVQGGAFDDLRRASVDAVCEHDLVGYAIGGVSVGEDRGAAMAAVEASAPHLPEDRPRYLMGVGTPGDFVEAVARGIDMFDCVTPTRHGRTHQAFTSEGRLNLRNQKHQRDDRPLEEGCDCPACAGFTRAYLRHLCTTGEMLGAMLLTLHNLRFFHRLMERIRRAIPEGRFEELRREVRAKGRG
jgi:queuine tRNA-ribosyltransferase